VTVNAGGATANARRLNDPVVHRRRHDLSIRPR
jgi:hypothetical protein